MFVDAKGALHSGIEAKSVIVAFIIATVFVCLCVCVLVGCEVGPKLLIIIEMKECTS